MSEIQQMFNPPRAPTVPQPLPQTSFGVLEHTGLPYSEPLNVTDVPPDFEWMYSLQSFMGMFTYNKNDEIGNEISAFSVTSPYFGSDQKLWQMAPIWQHIPFTTAKWFNATFSFKMIAICPPRVTGKLLVRYSFTTPHTDVGNPPYTYDQLRRGICKEWDLGQSNIFEFDVTALSPIEARPTWIPERAFQQKAAVSPYVAQTLNPSITSLGMIRVEPAQYLQPGSIFPDSIRILVFRSFKNANFYTPTDPRSGLPHILARPWPVRPIPHEIAPKTT